MTGMRRSGLTVAARVGLVASILASWFFLTPLGFGMDWQGLAPSWHAKLFFLAPVVAPVLAGVAALIRPRSLVPEMVLFAAPLYQAVYLLASNLRAGS